MQAPPGSQSSEAVFEGEIDSQDKLEAWLASAPISWRRQMLARMMFRILPAAVELVVPAPPDAYEIRTKSAFLSLLRAAHAMWTVEAYQADHVHFPEDAAGRIDELRQTLLNGESGQTDFWRAVNADRQWLERDPKMRLTEQPLWLEAEGFPARPPEWVDRNLADLEKSELVQNGPWGLWLYWYRAILPEDPGSAPQSPWGERLDIEIASRPEEFWRTSQDDEAAAEETPSADVEEAKA